MTKPVRASIGLCAVAAGVPSSLVIAFVMDADAFLVAWVVTDVTRPRHILPLKLGRGGPKK